MDGGLVSEPTTTALDSSQLAAILACIVTVAGIIGAAIRWSAKRIIRALDANSDSNVKLTEKLAVFTVRLEDVTRFVEEHTPVNQPIPKPRRVTPAFGSEYSYTRPKTRGGDE